MSNLLKYQMEIEQLNKMIEKLEDKKEKLFDLIDQEEEKESVVL